MRDDNFLLYYAGHGELNRKTNIGYWIPSDAEKDFPGDWLSTNEINETLKMVRAKNILVAADSCYSGTLTRGIKIEESQDSDSNIEFIKRLHEKRSRIVITSGGDEPVLDQKNEDDRYSVFATPLINALKNNHEIVPAHTIFNKVMTYVVSEAKQTPIYSHMKDLDHRGGDFIFAPIN